MQLIIGDVSWRPTMQQVHALMDVIKASKIIPEKDPPICTLVNNPMSWYRDQIGRTLQFNAPLFDAYVQQIEPLVGKQHAHTIISLLFGQVEDTAQSQRCHTELILAEEQWMAQQHANDDAQTVLRVKRDPQPVSTDYLKDPE